MLTGARQVGIENEALFVGRLDKFEIWIPKRFQSKLRDERAMQELGMLLI